MDKVDFIAGNEKRFFDFVSKLNEEKMIVVSHTDLDGVASAKVVSAALNSASNAADVEFLDYPELNLEFVEKLKRRKIKKVILCDLSLDRPEIVLEIEKFADVLIIDHHLFEKDLNSDKSVFMSAHGYCTAYISYYLFSKIKNLERFDWLVAAASLADFCYKKNAKWLEKVCEKYGDTFVIEDFSKKNKIYDLAEKISLMLVYFRGKIKNAYESMGDEMSSLGNIENYAKDVRKEADESFSRFEKEKRISGNGDVYYWEFEPEFFVKSIVINRLSKIYPNKTLIIAERNVRHYEISARRQDGKVNLVELLKKLVSGFENCSAGGHISAAGASFHLKDIAEFRKRVQKL